MEIAHYFEWEQYMTGGHLQSVKNQRNVLDRRDIAYTTKPDCTADILHLNNYGPKSVYYARKASRQGTPVVIHTHQTVEDLKNSFLLSNLWAPPLRPYPSRIPGFLSRFLFRPLEGYHRKSHTSPNTWSTLDPRERVGTQRQVVGTLSDCVPLRGFAGTLFNLLWLSELTGTG